MASEIKREQYLVVFPWAGGTAASFIYWHSCFSRLFVVEYAGHGARMREMLPLAMTELLSDVQLQIEKNIPEGSELILFGHSMGGMVAAEIAVALEKNRKYSLKAVCLSSVIFPRVAIQDSAIAEVVLCDKNSASYLNRIAPVERGQDIADQLDFVLRQDLDLISRHAWKIAFSTLPVPVYYFYGEQDTLLAGQNLEQWKACIPNQQIQAFSGGHFYLEDAYNREKLVHIINKMLQER
jgi:surfactin synthase thioesterase subunit